MVRPAGCRAPGSAITSLGDPRRSSTQEEVVFPGLPRARRAALALASIPNRDCGGLSAGGAPTEAAYSAWVDMVVRGINNRKAVVLVEPDALSTDCATGAGRARTIATAVGKLKANPHAYVYLDG